ncbi:MAG: hypothetical protein HDT28_03390 [Clostridiales bacterium]|nr:hypothetical protein [Clostridiales bacterium]
MNKAEKKFHNKIVKLLPSKDLQAAVAEQDFEFGYLDLLRFIEDYASTFDKKIELFGEAAEVFADKQEAKHALTLIEHNKNIYAEFMVPSADAVYEVDIKCDPWDKEDTFIAKTFDDCLTIIKAFIKHYADVGAHDHELSRYIITKKTAIPPSKPSDIGKKIGYLGQCILGKGLKVKSVDISSVDYCEYACKKKVCFGCKRPCICMYSPEYPKFIEKYDLVAWHTGDYSLIDENKWNSPDGYSDLAYGVYALDMDECNEDSYVVMLDNKYVRERKAGEGDPENGYPVYYAHEHPSLAKVFKPKLDDIPQNVKDDYLYLVGALKEIDLKITMSKITDED